MIRGFLRFDSVQGLDRREEEMSRFFHLVVILVSFLYQSIATARQDLHTFLSKDELRRYLQTDSYETVPEYDVVKVHNHRSKRNEFSTKQDYRLSAFGKDFALTLQPNDDVIPDTGLPIERRKRDGVVVKEIHHPHGRFYEGQLTSDPNSHVTVRETDKKGQLSGAIVSDGHLYHLEPLPDHLHRRAVLQGPGYHVISKRSARDLPNQKFMSTHNKEGTQEHEEVQDDQSETEKTRMKRDDVYKGNIYIEAMLTADKTTCDFYGNETLDYLLNIANLVSRLYKDKSIGMPVSWVLTKVFLIEGFDPDLDFAANNIRSAGSYFWKYKSWTLNRNTANGKQEHYDIAALLTRSVCGLNSCSINGVANKGLCGKYPGVSINVAIGLGAAYTVTHDMAHNIGLGHDTGDCHKMGAIMHRQQAYGPKAFHWSPCSMNQLKQRFTKNMTNTLYTSSDIIACEGRCGALFCERKGGSCFSRSSPIAEGTLCGVKKICLAGHCRHEPRVPLPIDGGWGSWGPYEVCTRTCGGGVRYRSRQCNNPVPKFYGETCEGSTKGHFELCNTQECSVDRFRHHQCEAHNTDSTKYHPHFLGGSSKCTLACVTGSRGDYFGDVKDGTRCEGNKNVFDVCIGGKCVPVGCDKKLRSGNVFDRCLNCGGNGGTCVLVTGT
ncbi:A disintegrin and metalloproteinase with thrombospondin motifs 1-like [Stylophora pistillata]|uniref:A disintegrin and metalloproteinase with thrombospondin motifs 1-like n=1 Tax=Stylophora pistillata TaxID=50429 RepID=UPI000C052D76|nr:A disintegrin and metalloproteinase with thrombospondin motifs 1-like [Stylophora pistillata]